MNVINKIGQAASDAKGKVAQEADKVIKKVQK